MRTPVPGRVAATIGLVLCLATGPALAQRPTTDDYRKLGRDVARHFDDHVLKPWFPAAVDAERGGFRSNLSRDWKPTAARGDRFLVFQSRMTWLSAQIAVRRADRREEFLKYTRHGVAQLEKMWDAEKGGLYWGLDDQNKPTASFGQRKHAYGTSFAIYALAAAYEATGDAAALTLAMRTFAWFDDHAHDAKNGGYHELLERDGTPVLPADLSVTTGPNRVGFPNAVIGYKSMNSHIHLLEAFTALYHAKKDERVKRRLEELFLLVRDVITVEPGCMNLFFSPDWKPVPDHDSFGHDIETAFLLVEAAETLGRHDDLARTWTVARHLVDHALDWGFDAERGGFYDKGAAFKPAHDTAKVWWTQAEGLNALLLMHEKFGGQTDRYWKAWQLTWTFVNAHQVDREQGGWYDTVAADGTVTRAGKAHNWKAGYHDGRALMTMAERLARMGN